MAAPAPRPAPSCLECGGLDEDCRGSPSFQGPLASTSPWSPSPVESLGKNYDLRAFGVGAIRADAEGRLAHALQGRGERPHVGDLAGHQELQGVLRARVAAEVDQPLIDDLGAGFGGDVAAQIDVKLTGDLQVVRCPRVAHRVEQADTAAAGDGDQRIGFGFLADGFHRLEMQARQGAYDFKVAQLFGADVHQTGLAAAGSSQMQALDGILHRRGELAVGAAELLEQLYCTKLQVQLHRSEEQTA